MGDMAVRDAVIAKKILYEIKDIEDYVQGMQKTDFCNDSKTQKAVVMSLINIGELSRSFTKEFIESKSMIPWKKAQAMRNVATHKYEIIDMKIVWDTIQISIAELKTELEQ